MVHILLKIGLIENYLRFLFQCELQLNRCRTFVLNRVYQGTTASGDSHEDGERRFVVCSPFLL